MLLVAPLANIVFGADVLYGAREFVELLLANLGWRRELFAGLYLGLTLPVAGAAVFGIGVPPLLQASSLATLRTAGLLAVICVALSAVFTGIAVVIAYSIE